MVSLHTSKQHPKKSIACEPTNENEVSRKSIFVSSKFQKSVILQSPSPLHIYHNSLKILIVRGSHKESQLYVLFFCTRRNNRGGCWRWRSVHNVEEPLLVGNFQKNVCYNFTCSISYSHFSSYLATTNGARTPDNKQQQKGWVEISQVVYITFYMEVFFRF